MKSIVLAIVLSGLISSSLYAQSGAAQDASKNLYMDVHHIGPGKVKYADVAKAHAKDLATEKKYGVHFIKYWVDESAGTVYCLATAPDTQAMVKTHAEAHGLLPDQVYLVKSGTEGAFDAGKKFYLDFHHLGAGNVTAEAVAGAHQKDLATEGKYGVNFVNYWVDPKKGVVVCLSQSPDTAAIIATHKEAHGLLPDHIEVVKQGQ